jgi:hypothetical protein
MSETPLKNSHAPVAEPNPKADDANDIAPEIKQQKKTPNALRRAVKTWLDMLVASTSGRS